MKAANYEKAQSAVDEFFTENNIGVKDIDDLLREHMRAPNTMGKKIYKQVTRNREGTRNI